MRKIILVPALLCGMAVTAGAQANISARLTCAKPARETGGEGAQMIMFSRTRCDWSPSFIIDGSKPTRTDNAGIADISGSSGRGHGYSTSVFGNGDTTFVRYEATLQMKKDGSGTNKGTWKYVRGTGKFSGISGSGTFKGVAAPDGSGYSDVNGHYSLPKAKAKKTK